MDQLALATTSIGETVERIRSGSSARAHERLHNKEWKQPERNLNAAKTLMDGKKTRSGGDNKSRLRWSTGEPVQIKRQTKGGGQGFRLRKIVWGRKRNMSTDGLSGK